MFEAYEAGSDFDAVAAQLNHGIENGQPSGFEQMSQVPIGLELLVLKLSYPKLQNTKSNKCNK